MIAVDSNVLVRFLTRDDEQQAKAAYALLARQTSKESVFVATVVLVETVWALRSVYGYSREQVRSAVAALLDTQELAIQDRDAVSNALGRTGAAIDFADALIAELGTAAGAEYTATFDRGAAQLPGMRLLDA